MGTTQIWGLPRERSRQLLRLRLVSGLDIRAMGDMYSQIRLGRPEGLRGPECKPCLERVRKYWRGWRRGVHQLLASASDLRIVHILPIASIKAMSSFENSCSVKTKLPKKAIIEVRFHDVECYAQVYKEYTLVVVSGCHRVVICQRMDRSPRLSSGARASAVQSQDCMIRGTLESKRRAFQSFR